MEKEQTLYYFEKAPVSNAIAKFSIPMMITMLVGVLYNLVDTAFVGMMGDTNALAAVSLAMPVFLITNGVGQVFGVGCGSYISRLLGKKDYGRVKQVSAFALYGSIIIGIIVIAFGFIFLEPILHILGTSPNTIEQTEQYFTVLLGGGLTSILGFALSMTIRAAGDAKAATTGNLIGTVANIVLDPIFIFSLGMGVRGAAIATVLGQLIALMFYVRHIARKSSFLSISLSDFKVDREIIKSVFSIGLPSFFMKALYVVGFLIQNNIAAGFGDIYVAIFGLVFKIVTLPKQLSQGLCMGVQPVIGYNSSAQNFERMRGTVRKSLVYATLLGAVFAIVYFLLSGTILRLFINDVNIIAMGAPFLRIVVISFLAYGTMYTTSTLFQATGFAAPTFIVSLVQEAVLIPMVLTGSAVLGVSGIAWAIPAGDVTAMLIGLILQFVYRKKLYTGESIAVASDGQVNDLD
jgi:multidrug efflux pump